ncbi:MULTISPECIES: FMN-binding negative transcriptional regulator [Stenotrophomonas]|jgi:transcriptional regulator|uniref:FMN-binding negative transcriptional regulator n=1 Tax=Stenotrophomonas TaxID=40323 RepID=UPI00201CE601|nr:MULTISPECIES: FMN-binding negative transcriptional regulator [Stenotrophomonas]MDQ1062268.1 transcriptional regulator [Stenotrophomonas sp. SORGH_AS_0282]MDQ1189375.1 transcriptional regulator [Stenotrophomonas sp. SORGH_AS_0282]UQY86286.1 FMN-binding negative transcriptional regulator [Stenotrophomonas rhizophila]
MFIPADFVETDLAWLDRLLERDAFVTVVTTGSGGLPQVTLLPVVYRRDGDDILIEGHWARPNPQAGHAGPALILVHGPHGYVSPGWYPDKEAQARVPTWNYAAAELRGTLEPVTDPDALIDMLDRLSARYEAQVGGDWDLLPIEPRQRRMLAGIIGFRFRAQQVQIKLKLSQNHPQANQHGVIDALSALDSPPSHELAQWMRWKLEVPH